MKYQEVIQSMRQGGASHDMTAELIGHLAQGNGFVPDIQQALLAVERAYKGDPDRNLTNEVSDYVMASSGLFLSTDVYSCLQLSTRTAKKTASQVLSRLVLSGVIERTGTRNGQFRLVETDSPVLDWQNADIANTVPVLWPFNLHEYVALFPRNIAIVAGTFNAGKTAFLLNFIKLNMYDFPIHYWTSEMGPEEMKKRLSKFRDVDINDWRFDARERSGKFADVIVPDGINVIDYLEVSKDFFLVGEEIKAIHDRLRKGLAVIALQKKSGAELGRGAELSAEKARLYITIDPGVLKIVKGKNWAIEDFNPNGTQFTFKLHKGADFEWQEGNWEQ